MPRRLRNLLKRSKALIVATNLLRYARLALLSRIRPNRPVRLGARHRGFSLEQSVDYVDWVVGDYERYCGVNADTLKGARVLELGPGDSLGVALRLLAMGASRVICLDRFPTWRDPEQQRQINTALAGRMVPGERERLADVLAGGELVRGQDRLVLIEGTGIEDADRVLPPAGIDLIVSRAVLAHVFDLDRAYQTMDRLLASEGRMAHKVDLSDIGLFSGGGHNPLTHLTIRDWVWDRMRRYTGHPNRQLADYHLRKLTELGYEVELLATKLIGEPDELSPPLELAEIEGRLAGSRKVIEEIRPRLLERYRRMTDDNLAIAGVFIRARKP